MVVFAQTGAQNANPAKLSNRNGQRVGGVGCWARIMTDTQFWCTVLRLLKGLVAAIEQMLERERVRQGIKSTKQD
jgi:hypothetical protein